MEKFEIKSIHRIGLFLYPQMEIKVFTEERLTQKTHELVSLQEKNNPNPAQIPSSSPKDTKWIQMVNVLWTVLKCQRISL